MIKESIWDKDKKKTIAVEALSKNLDLTGIVFYALHSVRNHLEEQSPKFLSGVESLESILCPYLDGSYNSDIELIENNFNSDIEASKRKTRIEQSMLNNEARWTRAIEKFKALSCLCYRTKFYPVLKKEYRSTGNIDPLAVRVHKLVFKENRHAIILITGGTGTGKSYVALKLAKNIDPKITAENLHERLIFKPEDFGRAVISNKLKRGSVLIFDEAGVGIGARDFQTVTNKAIAKTVQTMRFRNIVVIITVPNLEWIDAIVRKSIHFWIKTQVIDFEAESTKVRVVKYQYNESLKKHYEHFLKDKDGKKYDPLWYDLVDDPALIDEYEKLSRAYKTHIATSGSQAISDFTEKQMKKDNVIKIDYVAIADKIEPEMDDMLKHMSTKTIIPLEALRTRYDMGHADARMVKSILDKRILDRRKIHNTIISSNETLLNAQKSENSPAKNKDVSSGQTDTKVS